MVLGTAHAKKAKTKGFKAMKLAKLLHILYQIKLLSPLALFRLASSILTYGINLMALLSFSARTYSRSVALVDEQGTYTYNELFTQAEALAMTLQEKAALTSGKKVGVLCRNHASLVKSLFAISSSGADLYLLHPDMSADQLDHILVQHDFDLLIYDEERESLLEQTSYSKAKIRSDHEAFLAKGTKVAPNQPHSRKQQRNSSGKLVLLTSGTTGAAKRAAHQPSLFRYLDPFADFLSRLNILHYRNAYIATPLYHGYGLAVLLLFFAVGKQVVITRRFEAEHACRLIRKHQIEVVTVVPLMLHRMLRTHNRDLTSLSCIASGSAELHPRLVKETLSQLGEVLYNLYGTSETGLNLIATPQDLAYAAHTIGKPVKGVQIHIVDEQGKEVGIGKTGQLIVSNSGSISNHTDHWIRTGDLGYRDEEGYYYLSGRVDDMIVSAGVNVYPLEVERVLLSHPLVVDAGVIGIRDEQYGHRLRAYVVLATGAEATSEELREWLRPRLATYQRPKELVIVDNLPYTPLGKLDRRGNINLS